VPLLSKLFRGDTRLQACLQYDQSHVAPGSVGEFVSRIQTALMLLDELTIDAPEISAKRYGVSTARAVLSYKTARNIVNRSYQTKADNIVGKMTIASLDQEMLQRERATAIVVESIVCEIIRDPDPIV